MEHETVLYSLEEVMANHIVVLGVVEGELSAIDTLNSGDLGAREESESRHFNSLRI